jgi:thymidylate kinase
MAFYFDVTPETILARERTPEQGLDYLRAKQTLFKNKISAWHLIVIDAHKSKEEIFQVINHNIAK